MFSVYDLKPKFQALLEPALELAHKYKITPNQLTGAALLLSFLFGCWLYFARVALLLLPMVLLVRMALNALDGMLARRYHLSSTTGEVWNELGDVLADLFLYLPLVAYLPWHWGSVLLVFLFVYLAALTEFCGLLSKVIIRQRAYQGPLGKSDRAVVIGVLALVWYFLPDFIINSAALIFGLLCILCVWTGFNRLRPIFRPQ